MTFKLPKLRHFNYCPYCRKRTEHVADEFQLLCKRCGRRYKKTVATSLAQPQQKFSRSVGRYFKKVLPKSKKWEKGYSNEQLFGTYDYK